MTSRVHIGLPPCECAMCDACREAFRATKAAYLALDKRLREAALKLRRGKLTPIEALVWLKEATASLDAVQD